MHELSFGTLASSRDTRHTRRVNDAVPIAPQSKASPQVRLPENLNGKLFSLVEY